MDRGGWLTWALTATLIAGVVGANGFQLTSSMVDEMVEQSQVAPPASSWTFPFAHWLIAGGIVLGAASGWGLSYGWAKLRAKSVEDKRRPKPEKEEDEDDQFALPPGFGETRIRTKRHGAAPLAGFTVLAVALLGGAGVLTFFGIITLVQTTGMDGMASDTASLFGGFLRFVAFPVGTLGGLVLGMAWGRWFPLGELEVIQEKVQRERLTRATWDRQN